MKAGLSESSVDALCNALSGKASENECIEVIDAIKDPSSELGREFGDEADFYIFAIQNAFGESKSKAQTQKTTQRPTKLSREIERARKGSSTDTIAHGQSDTFASSSEPDASTSQPQSEQATAVETITSTEPSMPKTDNAHQSGTVETLKVIIAIPGWGLAILIAILVVLLLLLVLQSWTLMVQLSGRQMDEKHVPIALGKEDLKSKTACA